ncbi:MAG: GNAT family N-acetyltransferase [Candidatus Viridilinea halotolerans]|uniref:GNAT family N-acetyltransferase n=1 Tax=Candidatus Viridilinea halotolerans TaxID=2491704 RepID=A0A426TT27_9CHLR|nr:MAG: GNAT family N-acetyltransferase [Candidatus Viridilinea halotolerans]
MHQLITTYHLELCDPAELRPAALPTDLNVVCAELPCPEFNRFLYTAVGGQWYWIERLTWSYAQWLAYLQRPELATWVGYVAGTPVGYVELERQAAASVELVYFGLLPAFIGRGLGGALLTVAIQRAWAMGAARVSVHTCTLDGPAALANYQARGMRIFKTEETSVDLPAQPPGPWPGA